MTRDETLIIMGTLKTAYPQYYKAMNKQEAENAVSLWADMFSSDDLPIVIAAVKSFLATDTKGFPPHIGAIKEQIEKLNEHGNGGAMTEMEAWMHVNKALKNGFYGSHDEFKKLPEEVQHIVGGPEMLKTWAMMDESEVGTVVASNFMRSFRARQESQREFRKLPASALKMTEILSDKFKMPEMLE